MDMISYPNQQGFRESHDTSNSIRKVIVFVNNNCDNNLKNIGIFLNLAKAFDTVNHDIFYIK